MINDSVEILSGVSARCLHPMLLVQSQSHDAIGFIMAMYQEQLNSHDMRKFYDLYFFEGAVNVEYARLNQDLRFLLSHNTAIATFNRLRDNSLTKVFLFHASESTITRFRSTFHYEPCLKVQLEALSLTQIQNLLKMSRCRKGIIECNEFTSDKPSIQLTDINSQDDLMNFEPAYSHGRVLLYDAEKNKEILSERGDSIAIDKSSSSDSPTTPNIFDVSTKNDLSLSIPKDSFRITLNEDAHNSSPKSLALQDNESSSAKQEADEFAKVIDKILNTPLSGNATTVSKPEQPSTEQMIIRTPTASVPPELPTLQSNPVQPRKPRNRRSNKKILVPKTGSNSSISPNSPISPIQPGSNIVHLFERLFRSYRQQVVESYGEKSNTVINRAVQKVQFLTPEFNLLLLTDVTAPLLLDVVEAIIDEASLFKKSKLRQSASILISDLYNKNFDILEKSAVLDKVEQSYYRLKK